MAPFGDRIIQAMIEKKSPLCVGLDPNYDQIPDFLKENHSPLKAIEIFLHEIIDAVTPYCAVLKPNLAYFEAWGWEGLKLLEEICERAKMSGVFIIADGKRNDIGHSATEYAKAFLSEGKPYDALTVNPYLGIDGILPFIELAKQNKKGIFVLVRTSNQSAGEFQDLPVGDSLLHEEVARMVARVGENTIGSSGFSSVGAVVGATDPDSLKILRSEMPTQLFLVPGYGTQGGSAGDVKSAFYASGHGAIINSSRSIIYAGNGTDFAEKAASAAKRAMTELSEIIAAA